MRDRLTEQTDRHQTEEHMRLADTITSEPLKLCYALPSD
jgi:hypothetical protein